MNISRRGFMGAGAALFASTGLNAFAEKPVKDENGKVIAGFDDTYPGDLQDKPWEPFSDKKVRVGIAGCGLCEFGASFGYQNHPNVEVVACTDLFPDRCELLQRLTGAKKTYPSCEEMIKHAAEDKLDAVYIATDAPSHARLAIMAFEHGLHVCSAVPAFFGKDQLELVPKMIDAQKASGKLYMMNETSAFRAEGYAMRRLYESGVLGDIHYVEGEYFHSGREDPNSVTGSYNDWRWGLPPMYYPTHNNAFYTCTTHKRFLNVVCQGRPNGYYRHLNPLRNRYANSYGSEFAIMKCEDGATASMRVMWDAHSSGAETGRIYGSDASYNPADTDNPFCGLKGVRKCPIDIRKPRLPPGVPAGYHGGSHGYLTEDFIRGILVKDHKVCVDLKTALDTTIAGVYAHMSAIKGGEKLDIPAVM